MKIEVQMKTRTYEEMIGLILSFAEADDRVRAVLLNGSRVNPAVKVDPFQDYDVVNVVTKASRSEELRTLFLILVM
jgi:hypothetical protein